MTTDGRHGTGANNVDWATAWREHLRRSGLRANLARQGISPEDFWKRYDGWQEVLRQAGYPGRVLEHIREKAEPHFTVLDIGAGAGAFALPLAKVTRLITAIEPSAWQSSRLRENAETMQVENLRVVESPWEDISLSEIGPHDLVLAAYCFEMDDIEAALQKMCLAARRYLVLVHTAGHDLIEPMRNLLGVEPGPDYIYLYNVLYQLGYRPNVTIFTRNYRIPLAIQIDMFRHNPGLDEKQCRRLLDWLEASNRISFSGGELWVERRHRDAMIWLDLDQHDSRNGFSEGGNE